MAKLRINGDTSGYIDLVAPAVAGTTTLNLPTSGIAPTNAPRFTGNMAVGTTNIESGANITLGRLDVTNEGGQISFNRSTDDTPYWNIDVYGNTSTPSLRFFNSGTVKMEIDSSGRVTMPLQPRFHVYGPSSGTSSSTLLYQNILVNNGNHYSTVTGRFTVPVNGTYMFFWSAIGSSTNDVYRYKIYKNGAMMNEAQVRIDTIASGSEYGFGEKTMMLNASANDYFTIYYQADGGTSTYIAETYVAFGGYLLG